MATIDYKEKYEKAVQAAMLAKQDTESAVTIGILEEIFPELRESEDEKIRNEIIAHIKWCEDSGYCAKEEMTRWITFLERQGEQMPDELIKEYDFHGMKIVPKFKKGDLIREKLSGRILTIKDYSYDNGLYTYDTGQFPITIQNHYELMEQKSTWSEEDEKMIRGLIVICDEWTTRHSFYPIENCEIEKLKNWLYSLKERCTWKPSEEQMNTLKSACGGNYVKLGILESLYVDLKKLREE